MGIQIGGTGINYSNSLDAGSLLPGNKRASGFVVWVLFVEREKACIQGKNTPPLLRGEYLSKYTGLFSLALGTPSGVI